jgi:hypothetical protein
VIVVGTLPLAVPGLVMDRRISGSLTIGAVKG